MVLYVQQSEGPYRSKIGGILRDSDFSRGAAAAALVADDKNRGIFAPSFCIIRLYDVTDCAVCCVYLTLVHAPLMARPP